MSRLLQLGLMLVLVSATAAAQAPPTADVLGSHNLGPGGTSSVKGQSSAACLYCHAPHSGLGGNTPLWSQTLSAQSYTLYSSTTMQNVPTQPGATSRSTLCLSCHDGTVGVGMKVPYGNLPMTGAMQEQNIFGGDLGNSHPFSLKAPLADAPHLVAGLAVSQTTADPQQKVRLVDGTVECRSCHEPHNQSIDPVAMKFLVRDAVNGQLCLACHTSSARVVGARQNPLAPWAGSVHATSGAQLKASARLGNYASVAQFACNSCHQTHNASGSALLQPAEPPAPWVDPSAQPCMTCHAGSNLEQPLANVFAEFAKAGHPLPSPGTQHSTTEPAVLANNRHATCADCHNVHGSQAVVTFTAAPGIRPSQAGAVGVDAGNGMTELRPAANQYEVCLRCHGTSPGKQILDIYGYLPMRAVSAADRLNLIPQLAVTATSSHPVLHLPKSPNPQPSLRKFMLKLDGVSESGRSLGAAESIFCTDCHNSDVNREFGGNGPNGPHGSQYSHMLERRYEFSQVAAGASPGTPIQNLFPNPEPSAGGAAPGPYALCAKCHDAGVVLSPVSWAPAATGRGGHPTHVATVGVSCSVCHAAHGVGALSASISGERLVNFDVKVVAPNGAAPISYNRGTNTCTLTCHARQHNSDGTVVPAAVTALAPR